MPKIIPNVKGRVLGYVKEQLLAGRSRSISIIDIANACNIATGTVFNYFESKDMIFATIILEDWNAALAKMRENSKNAESTSAAIDAIYAALKEFVDTYRAAWKDYTSNGNILNIMGVHHSVLRGQLMEIICGLELPECKDKQMLALIIIENLLWIVRDGNVSYEECKNVIFSLIHD